MNVVILTTIANTFGRKGYYQSQETGLAKALAERGHEVKIIKWVTKKAKEEEVKIGDHITLHYIPGRSLGVHGRIPLKTIRKLAGHPDAVLCFSDTQMFIPGIMKYFLKQGVAFIPYCGVGHSAQRNLKSKLFDLLFAMRLLKLYKKNGIIAKTPQAAEEFRNLGVTDIEVVPVGLDMSALNRSFREADRDKLREEYGYTADDIVISYIARLEEGRHPDEAVKILKKLKDRNPERKYKLIMVGDGYMKHDVEVVIQECGVEDSVRMISKVPYSEMWKIHYMADFLLDLNADEIFGMALSEAVFYKSSVTAMHAPGPDLILPEMHGHILCNGYDEMIDWIAKGRPDDSILDADSVRLAERFSWNSCVNAIEKRAGIKEDAS